mmetsp:Transcript_7484/g.17135  ORF Transcript_7484/g.17135 Transcript_7484/m.17135 type:complete len:171 (-) Transcript_7484:1401-1913(-)
MLALTKVTVATSYECSLQFQAQFKKVFDLLHGYQVELRSVDATLSQNPRERSIVVSSMVPTINLFCPPPCFSCITTFCPSGDWTPSSYRLDENRRHSYTDYVIICRLLIPIEEQCQEKRRATNQDIMHFGPFLPLCDTKVRIEMNETAGSNPGTCQQSVLNLPKTDIFDQ